MVRTITRLAAPMALALVAGLTSGCAPSPDADIGCAWPIAADETQSNVAYPDTGATYWATRYRLVPGQQLRIEGTYPFARYTSLVTYGANGSAIDHLADRDIAADAGSDNPFASTPASTDPAHRRYTVTVDPNAWPGGTDNVIAPVAPPGSTANGTVILRIYVPDDASDPAGGVPLPTLSVRNADGSTVAVPACPTQAPDPGVVDLINLFGPATDQPALDPPLVARPLTVSGLYANPDNTYVAAVVAHQPGRVLVLRGRAPSFPDTEAGQPATTPSQLRYWSVCMNEYRKPYPVTSCATDAQTALDPSGDYTIVVSTPADRPANATTAEGVTWLDWGSTAVNGLVIVRNMLPDPTFAEAAQNVAPGAPASSSMGVYAPVARYCSTADFESSGAAACGS